MIGRLDYVVVAVNYKQIMTDLFSNKLLYKFRLRFGTYGIKTLLMIPRTN